MKDKLYHYRAEIVSVYDGDTCTADIDLGLGVWVRGEKLRLLRINAPEMRGDEKEAGRSSRDFLRELILGKEVFIETIKDKRGKYGRYLAEIWLEEAPEKWVNVNDLMVEAEHAVYKEY
ncbi:MAG: thermonuclease family protein [Kiritimatiellales bacterium]|nr:thermonuclease family protein [Kiritimatiellales bacterium]